MWEENYNDLEETRQIVDNAACFTFVVLAVSDFYANTSSGCLEISRILIKYSEGAPWIFKYSNAMRAKIYEAELIAEGTLHGSCVVKSRKVANKRPDYAVLLFPIVSLSLCSVSYD